jgi:hypothetical protein
MSPGVRRNVESILVLVVIVLAVLAAIRLASRDAERTVWEDASTVPEPGDIQAAGTPPSPACNELLARIRSCSAQELDGLVDKMGPLEAYSLYKRLSVADRGRVFAALPVPLVARKANELLGIPAASFRHASSPGNLANTLVDVAMGTPVAATGGQPRQLSFATAVDGQNAPVDPRGTFRADVRRIHVCFDAGPESEVVEAGVLVRWTEDGPGTVLYLRYQPFSINRRWNYVYYEPPSWTPGTYRVQFYRMGEPIALLAEGTYVIGAGN